MKLMENTAIAKFFWDISKLLEMKDENRFRIRSYQKAAQTVESYPEDIEDIYRTKGIKGLEEIPGIGESLSRKIEEIIKRGKPLIMKELYTKTPPGLLEMTDIRGIGPKFALQAYKNLNISSVDQLEKAARSGKLKTLEGVKDKKIGNIIKGIDLYRKKSSSFYLGKVLPFAEAIVNDLERSKLAGRLLICGSLRRMKETIGDIDILAASPSPKKLTDYFVNLKQVKDVIAKGNTKTSVLLKNGMNCDLRVVDGRSFGSAAHYFTGSKQHNIKLRTIAGKRGLKLNEYGVFSGNKKIAGKTEEEVFKAFKLPYIPPEIREDTGELEAAAKNKLPDLVKISDIRGDLHVHSNYTDGSTTIEEMALSAKKLGYEYIAITDHSASTRVAGGLSIKELLNQMKEIDKINKKIKGIRILKGSEVDIRPDGSLDFPDEILKQLDIVIISVHSNFNMDEAAMTKRIIKALENKYSTILAHPTGRLLSSRDPYRVDIEKIIKAAARTGTALELNAHPERLDLNDVHCKLAKQNGVMIAINTDSHAPVHLEYMRYGIGTAGRGWIEKKDVLNCLWLKMLLRGLNGRR